ncbi:MAG TPA: efflux RND transporter periplasmic adaptor subunit [Terriglobia bacterium]|nr:efflux RND transporter periplasmic adaptor subunit [Terriglobia bacterium]
MRNYRNAFWIVLAVNILLIAVIAAKWWRARTLITSGSLQPAAAAGQSPAGTPPLPNTSEESAGKAGEPAAAANFEAQLVPIQLSTQRLQSIGARTGQVEMKSIHDEIRATGNVEVDEERLAYVQVRFPGWIQRVYASATYLYVRKGQPLFTIYSPDLVSSQEEYLLARKNGGLLAQSSVPGVATGAASLVDSAKERLKQWGIPEREIAQLESTGKVRRELEIDSPVSGYITERNALPNLYVQPETRLYTIADLSTVWVNAEVNQNDIGKLKAGDPATVTVDSYPGRTFKGRMDSILPQVDMTTRTVRTRLVFSNPGLALKPGMYVDVSLDLPLGRQLVIPASGVFQSGTRQIAFIDHGGGNLEPREIQLARQVGEEYVVLKGLRAGDKIITSANFLIDSESQLQAALGSFVPPPPGAGAAAAINAPANGATVDFSTVPSPPRRGSNTFRVKLSGSDGAPVAGAQVTVTFFMPAMPAMGMGAMRVVSNLSDQGGGVYEGRGELESGGTWQVTIVAQKNGQTLVNKQLHVDAEGEM